MRRAGTDENNVQMSDVLCDFCESPWTESRPMVEGHQGSCICGSCLTAAYRALVLENAGGEGPSVRCVLCLETRKEPGWQGTVRPEVAVCRRCVKQSAAVLAKDPDLGWKKPV